MTALYVDADACPVRAEAERVALRHKVRMFVVSNGGLRPAAHPLVETVVVPDGPDVADRWIIDRCGPGDIVVTADIPLADAAIARGARVLTPEGEALHPGNIGPRRAARDLMADLRGANPLGQGGGGGGGGFTKAHRARFLDRLEHEMRTALKPD